MKNSDSLKFINTHALGLFIVCYVACIVAVGIATNFLVVNNDFWDNCFIAQHLNFHLPQSLYNGFFPIGFHVLLRLFIAYIPPEIFGFGLNLGFTLLLFWAAFKLLPCLTTPNLSIVTLTLIASYPLLYHYNTTAGADPGAVAFFLVGCFFLLKAKKASGRRQSILCGLSFGLGALWRYHVLVAGGFLLIAFLIVNPREWRRIALSMAAMLVMFSPQMAINMLNGLGPLQTGHALAVYDCMYHINWYRITDYNFPASFFATVKLDPPLFIKNYLLGVLRLLLFAAPIFGYALLHKNNRISLVMALFFILYAGFFGFSIGGRAPLLLIPFTLIYLIGIYNSINERIRSRLKLRPKLHYVWRFLGSAGIIMLLILFITRDCLKIIDRHERGTFYTSIENELSAHGARAGTEIFSTDLDLYFRHINPNRPRLNSGWGIFGTYAWNQEYPQFNVMSIRGFIADCIKHNIGFVVLNQDVAMLSGALQALYEGHSSAPDELRSISTIGTNIIYRVKL
jgi:hypothetical protein